MLGAYLKFARVFKPFLTIKNKYNNQTLISYLCLTVCNLIEAQPCFNALLAHSVMTLRQGFVLLPIRDLIVFVRLCFFFFFTMYC